MMVFKHDNRFAIEEDKSEMVLGVQRASNIKKTTVKTYKIFIDGKLEFTAMDLTSAYHFIYVKSGHNEYITNDDFIYE